MRPLPRSLLAEARNRHGLLTTHDLTGAGIVGRARAAAFETGQLVTIHRGVYRLASHAESFEQRCAAACLAAPDAALSGLTAGRLWGLRRTHTDDVHLIARRAIRLEGVAAHRTVLLGGGDVTERAGMRVLRPHRLLCDLAAHLDEAALESVLEQMIDRHLVTIRGARAAARRFVAPGRPGSIRLSRVLDSRPAHLQPVDSDLELRLWRELARRGVCLDRQVPLLLDSGVTVHLDLADRGCRFGIEVDHVTWHGGRLDTQRDKRRDREVVRLAWTVVRVTDEDISTRLTETCDQLIDIHTRRSTRS